jgi:hypothetical protein
MTFLLSPDKKKYSRRKDVLLVHSCGLRGRGSTRRKDGHLVLMVQVFCTFSKLTAHDDEVSVCTCTRRAARTVALVVISPGWPRK